MMRENNQINKNIPMLESQKYKLQWFIEKHLYTKVSYSNNYNIGIF